MELSFLGDKAKLYKVNVFDGNKNIYWKRCITPGGDIDAEFLKAGPNGAFNPDGFYKADDAENTYEFTYC